MRYLQYSFCMIGLLYAFQAAAAPDELVLLGTLVELPRTRPCGDKPFTVVTRYRVESVLHGTLSSRQVLVMHRCPELARGQNRWVPGTAPALRTGDAHVLRLRPVAAERAGGHDRFVHDKGPRFEALQTDMGTKPPRVVVVIQGGAGASHTQSFDARSISIGSAPDADLRLTDTTLSPRQLLLFLDGDQLAVRDLSPTRGARINDQPIQGKVRITFKDLLRLGTYTLRAALFMDYPDEDSPES